MKSLKIFLLIVITVFLFDKIVFFALNSIDRFVLTGEGLGKVNHFLKVKDTTSIIVFGSSRANHHVDPLVFGVSSFNVGHGGTKMAFSATLIQTLPNKKEQYVLLQIDPSSIFDLNYKGKDIKSLSVKYHQNKVIKEKIDDLGMNNFFSPFLWSLDYNGKILSLIKNRLYPKYNFKEYHGYDPLINTKAQNKIRSNRFQKLKTKKCNDIYIPSQIDLMFLNDINSFCKKNHKKLILFTSPMFKDDCKDDNETLKGLLSNLNIIYYDFSDMFIENSDIEIWRDENHLSKKGADLFSKLLYSEVKNNLNNK